MGSSARDDDPRGFFGSRAADYAAHRPTYPSALLAQVEAAVGLHAGADLLDVGAGTGIGSTAWAARGHRVVALEPDASMLSAAPCALRVRGDAEHLPFRAESFDLVTAHQALHWFDLDRAAPEFARACRPRGHVAALWNTRRPEGLAAAFEEIATRWSDRFPPPGARDLSREVDAGTGGRVQVLEHDWDHPVTLEAFIGFARSTSYLGRGIEDRAGLESELRAAFERHADAGRAALAYRATAYVWPANAWS